MANAITCARIVICAVLLLLQPGTAAFSACYLLGGLSDMADGAIARRTRTETALGAKLDSFADFLFFAVNLGKLIPALPMTKGLWLWSGGIAVLKLGSAAAGAVSARSIAVHSGLNRLTGLLLFLLPMLRRTAAFQPAAILSCTLASAAAVQELWLLTRKNGAFAASANPCAKTEQTEE